ncbi:hypothetical protein ACFO3O_09655 [Dokdonia ponticola]|uniref:Transposase n=1 Tax=Dokdonia ponticola TaxID=2041041 RepID=A0ABV9HXX1_9FLAO
MGLKKINTIGIQQANKVMPLSAMAYHLKKYLKFTQKKVKSGVGMGILSVFYKITFDKRFWVDINVFKTRTEYEMA